MLGKAKHVASMLATALLLMVMTAAIGHAQGTTGKIQGRVVSTTGQPIASAQVTVDGTTLGNITNEEGFYFINQAPAGLRTVRAQSIGYRTQAIANQRIQAGQTVTLNFTLEQAAVALEPLVVAGERNPLVPRDQVSSKAIITGEEIDELPVDNASSMILLMPGVVQTRGGNGDFSVRGSREGEAAVYVDGVPIRNLRTGSAQTIDVPTNALAQFDLTTGGMSARYGNAQAGIANYVTRTGGTSFGGAAQLQSDLLSPTAMRTGFTRGELSLGGPLPFLNGLSFFVGGTAQGNKYAVLNEGTEIFVSKGVDTTIVVPRSGSVAGATDSVAVAIPSFVKWENGRTSPTQQSDNLNFTAKLSYGFGSSKLDLAWLTNRSQNLNRGVGDLYNPQGWGGNLTRANFLTASGYFVLAQSAEQALALDLKASYQMERFQGGTLQTSWINSHQAPFLGFNVSTMQFVMDKDNWKLNDNVVAAVRSGVDPPDVVALYPKRDDLASVQTLSGLGDPLRLNPYGMNSQWAIAGIGNANQQYTQENRVYLSASADWQMSRFNRFWVGGEMTLADTKNFAMGLYNTNVPTAVHYKPTLSAVYMQDRLDLGDVVLEGGLRLDRYDPDGQLPIIPGYVSNVPDSMRAGFMRLESGAIEAITADNRLAWSEFVVPIEDCGGEATAANRRRADGELVCKSNFVEAKVRTVLSPKLAVSFPVTATSTFRLSYGQNVQAPNLTGTGGMFSAVNIDLTDTNINQTFGRDVNIPRTILFEAGYRQVFGGSTVVDVAAYSKTTRNGLSFRRVQFNDPNTGQRQFLNTLVNADFSLARGLDLTLRRRFSEIADLSVNYSFLDARGTGSNPTSFTNLLLRRTTNVQQLTGVPPEAPEVLLPTDQSRAHTLAGTLSLVFGGDYLENNGLAHAVLGNAGVFATFSVASGLPYTRLENQALGQTGPPTNAGLSGRPAEALNSSRTDMLKRFDLRLTKGFQVAGREARFFADARNPLNLANTNAVFMETGSPVNAKYFESQIDKYLRDQTLDNDTDIDDFNIMNESPQNAVNKYLLLQAEKRFGNGDGNYTVEEQKNALSAWYNIFNGPQIFHNSNQQLRLGVEITF